MRSQFGATFTANRLQLVRTDRLPRQSTRSALTKSSLINDDNEVHADQTIPALQEGEEVGTKRGEPPETHEEVQEQSVMFQVRTETEDLRLVSHLVFVKVMK